ncbi:PREDICTED: galactose-3-O-sulfotransferase 3-like [Priapulus caudatus]|uniref:Galactose-3-O-sulfotransferase 3-like n=1 Tax=Priapulus caudatus TaxID=37621 RepID=A0ABM1DVE6_PRICU|nr:PREDICTED: galactose-3-O-sulfotransferase 3-like [Priapulus caudatus]
MHRLMPPATKYVAILREPYAQFWSTMNYFHGFQESSPLHGQRIRKQGKVFLGDPDFYYEYLDYSARHSIQMSHDLGLPARHRRNETEIAEFLRRTDEDFDLVLIREYFDESLVLLRRLLCWPLRSIVYQTRNAKTYETSVTPTTSSQEHENEDRNLRAAYRAWNAADARLYDHFNATLWKRIAREENFHEEVSFFRMTNRKVSIACARLGRLKKKSSAVRVRKSKWSPAFSIDGGVCHRLELDMISYLKRLKLSYYERSNSSKNA